MKTPIKLWIKLILLIYLNIFIRVENCHQLNSFINQDSNVERKHKNNLSEENLITFEDFNKYFNFRENENSDNGEKEVRMDNTYIKKKKIKNENKIKNSESESNNEKSIIHNKKTKESRIKKSKKNKDKNTNKIENYKDKEKEKDKNKDNKSISKDDSKYSNYSSEKTNDINIEEKIQYEVYDPHTNYKTLSSNNFPDELKNIKKFKLNSKHISKFALGFTAGYGLNTEVSKDIEECFKTKEKKENIENIITNISLEDTSNDLSESNQDSIVKKLIGVFSFLNCSAFKKSIFVFLKNKIIKWGVNSLIYIATGPIGILMKYGYDTVKLALEIKNFINTLHSHPIDYTKSGSALGRVIYYLSDLFMRRKRK